MIGIVDYGVGNLLNLKNAFDFQSIPAKIITEPHQINLASKLILPGVGAFTAAMEHLRQANMVEEIASFVAKGKPFMGVCVGMQLLFEWSEEGQHCPGLGLIEGRVRRLPSIGLKVPQIGWNSIDIQLDEPLLDGIPSASYFYFVHSYHVAPQNDACVAAFSDYGERFPAVVQHKNIFGTQFHPEKSSDHGLRLLANFARL